MQIGSWFQVLREINLKKIQSEAESRFSVLVVGEPLQTGPLADALAGAEATGARHPWVTEHRLPLASGLDVIRPAVALIATDDPALDPPREDALRRLSAAGACTVVVMRARPEALPASAWLPRGQEDARAAIPPVPSADEVARGLAPALAELDHETGALWLPIARQLPVLRAPYIDALVDDVAQTNAGFALSTGLVDLVPGFSLPMTAADVVVLTKNQIVMAYRIALAAGKPSDARTLVGEVIGVIGAGLLFRQIARELVGLLPVVGIVPKIAVAYAGTKLVGTVVRAWAIEGRRVQVAEMRQLYASTIDAGKRLAEELVARARDGRDDGALGAAGPTVGTRSGDAP